MATVNPTVTRGLGDGDGSLIQYQWTLTSADSDGAGIQCPEWADVTWVATGTWGGATLKPQGSADGVTYIATGLSNAAGGAETTATANKVFTTIERPLFVRPNLTTVGVGATIVVTALLRRTNPMRT